MLLVLVEEVAGRKEYFGGSIGGGGAVWQRPFRNQHWSQLLLLCRTLYLHPVCLSVCVLCVSYVSYVCPMRERQCFEVELWGRAVTARSPV